MEQIGGEGGLQNTLKSIYGQEIFDLILVTNSKEWSTHVGTCIFQLKQQSQIPFKRHNIFFICDQLEAEQSRGHFLLYRSVWLNHSHMCKNISSKNTQLLKEGLKPDFLMIGMCSLPSLFTYSATVDAEYIEAQPTKQFDRSELPTQKRLTFGFLYDRLDSKELSKPSIQTLLKERDGLQCVPIDFNQDMNAYCHYDVRITIQKIMYHIASKEIEY